MAYEPIVGYAYGQKQETGRGKAKIYQEVAGEDFWTMLTGDPDFYKKIIGFMGQLPEQYVDSFKQSYANASNRLIRDFSNMFCKDDGSIDWEKLVEYNSGSISRQAKEETEGNKQKIIEIMLENPYVTKKKIAEITGLSSSRISTLIKTMTDDELIKQAGTFRKNNWVVLK